MKIFPLILLFLALSSCYEKERDCADFKTGTYEFKYVLGGIERTGTFVRTDSLNIDYYENKIDSASIRWINDCEFIQQKIHPKSKSEEAAIHFKILNTTKNSYTFEYSLAVARGNKKRHVEKGLATKIE